MECLHMPMERFYSMDTFWFYWYHMLIIHRMFLFYYCTLLFSLFESKKGWKWQKKNRKVFKTKKVDGNEHVVFVWCKRFANYTDASFKRPQCKVSAWKAF